MSKDAKEIREEARELGEIILDLTAIRYELEASADKLDGMEASARFHRALAKRYRDRWSAESDAEYKAAYVALTPTMEIPCPPSDTPSMEGPFPQ
jgi:hypothetical protein